MSKQTSSEKRKRIIISICIAIGIAAVSAVTVLAGIPLVKFASDPQMFRDWVSDKGILGRLAFMGMVILQTVIAIIPGEPFEIAAGYAFGVIEGTCLCLISSTIGSMAIFYLVKKFGVKLVEVFFPAEKLHSVKFLKSSPKRDFLLLVIFAIPGTPKDFICYFAGLTDIKVFTWFLICSVGRFPSIITSTVGGDAIGEQNYTFALTVLIVTLLISGIGLWIYNIICKKHNSSNK